MKEIQKRVISGHLTKKKTSKAQRKAALVLAKDYLNLNKEL